MLAQISPSFTLWNLVQSSVMFAWVGVGVTTPDVVDVGEALDAGEPDVPTHT